MYRNRKSDKGTVMIFTNGESVILLKYMSDYIIEFETRELEKCRYKLRITSQQWLDKHSYEWIGNL